MTYYIYHIPGKKIGVTCDLNNRVTVQQGYKPGEYEVLESSRDIDYISDKELKLQKLYGYRVDMKPYKKLNQVKMNINVTSQTTTFPVPLNKLKGRLMDNIGLKWPTELGQFEITQANIPWIMQNAKTSMYNNDRCYIYNKAFYEAFFNPKDLPELFHPKDVGVLDGSDFPSIFDLIRDWASTRGLYKDGNTFTQYVKLQEEAGELAKALLKNDHDEINDAIGDMVVVLTNLAHLHGTEIEICIDEAYKVIANRTGKIINGTFVKDEN